MPTCQGCGFTYEDILNKCPYCGRGHIALTNGQNGAYACPNCKGQGQKLSAIIDEGTSTIEGYVPVRQEYVDKKGRVRGVTVQQKTVQVQQSSLARMFTPPVKPATIGNSAGIFGFFRIMIWLIILFIGIIFFSISSMLFSSTFGTPNQSTSDLIISIILLLVLEFIALAIAGGFIFGLYKIDGYIRKILSNTIEKAKQDNDARQKAWQTQAERWASAFYCANCETLYIPGQTWFQPKQAYAKFLSGPTEG